jgi:hypothetical protein
MMKMAPPAGPGAVSDSKIKALFESYKEDASYMYNAGCNKFFKDIGINELGD